MRPSLKPLPYSFKNAGNNVAPFSISNQIDAEGANLEPLTFKILNGGIDKIYLWPQLLDQPLGQQLHTQYK